MKPAVTIFAVIGCSAAVYGASLKRRLLTLDEDIAAPVDKCAALRDCAKCTQAGCAWGTEVTVACEAGQCAEKSANGHCSAYDQCPGTNTKLFCFKYEMNCPKDAVVDETIATLSTMFSVDPPAGAMVDAMPAPLPLTAETLPPPPTVDETTVKPALLTSAPSAITPEIVETAPIIEPKIEPLLALPTVDETMVKPALLTSPPLTDVMVDAMPAPPPLTAETLLPPPTVDETTVKPALLTSAPPTGVMVDAMPPPSAITPEIVETAPIIEPKIEPLLALPTVDETMVKPALLTSPPLTGVMVDAMPAPPPLTAETLPPPPTVDETTVKPALLTSAPPTGVMVDAMAPPPPETAPLTVTTKPVPITEPIQVEPIAIPAPPPVDPKPIPVAPTIQAPVGITSVDGLIQPKVTTWTPVLTTVAKTPAKPLPVLSPNTLNPYVKFNPKSIASCPATKPTQGSTCQLAPSVICNYEIDARKRPKVIASCKGGIWIVNKKFYRN